MRQSTGVGLKGAALSGKADDVSTAGSEATEERSEAPDPSGRGLSGGSRFRHPRLSKSRHAPMQSSTHQPNHISSRGLFAPTSKHEAMDAEISPDEVRELLDDDPDVRVVDIRPEAQFEREHIPDSENIPFHALADEIESLDGAARIVTVCPKGKSSVQAARLISSYEGVPDDARVESMAGGLNEWEHGFERGGGGAEGDETKANRTDADETESDEGPEAPF